MSETITINRAAVVGLARELASLPWGSDEPICGSDLVDAVGFHVDDFLTAVEAAGVDLPEDWQTKEEEQDR